MIRVYLAGPDVFRPDAEAFAARLKSIAAAHGLAGVFPLDPLDAGDDPAWAGLPLPLAIARRNEAHIASCRAVIANLTPFRGPSADAGTVYEVGYARALGLPVFGWSTDPRPFAHRTRAFLGTSGERDAQGMLIEDFDRMHDNLMIDGAVAASGGRFITGEGLEAFELCCIKASYK